MENTMMLKGSPLSPGIARGTAVLFVEAQPAPAPTRQLAEAPGANRAVESQWLRRAVQEAQSALRSLQGVLRARSGRARTAMPDLLEGQILMLEDPALIGLALRLIEQDGVTAEQAVRDATSQYAQRFAEIPDTFFHERASEVRDVGHRLLTILNLGQNDPLGGIPTDGILVAREILPSITAMEHVRGLVAEETSAMSHAALLARSVGVPGVTGLAGVASRIRNGDRVIVDGHAGLVFINPDVRVEAEYEQLESQLREREQLAESQAELPSRTEDGADVRVYANIGKTADAEAAAAYGADGVGLFRTEFAFVIRDRFPSEEEQLSIASSVAGRLAPRPVVIRLLDIGGDKGLPYFPLAASPNPALAPRGLRLLLQHRDVLETQLRALLRAAASHPVRILLPMVTSLDEVREVKRMVARLASDLGREGHAANARAPLGALIETPAAVWLARDLAAELDFLSLGTNDLIQHVLVVDRQDLAAAPYFQPLQPALLRAIDAVCRAAAGRSRELTVCGELAADPAGIEILLGLGVRSLSVAPARIPEVRRVVRSCRIDTAERRARRALVGREARVSRGSKQQGGTA
jgi:phosphoenolpyruvate-protein phosphotransferase